jgi:hypothetical protein
MGYQLYVWHCTDPNFEVCQYSIRCLIVKQDYLILHPWVLCWKVTYFSCRVHDMQQILESQENSHTLNMLIFYSRCQYLKQSRIQIILHQWKRICLFFCIFTFKPFLDLQCRMSSTTFLIKHMIQQNNIYCNNFMNSTLWHCRSKS